eukprot:TRINITY_DN26224_c0_g1_i3.p1 TRINITY_DN26224_c0_g1~~TRINITY_DN26224_c0_g1_i3.p1  ORF type:complete len:871 (-),score=132.13 TRINITY_DN26224_c0_g1_i3:275-2887(-)
MPKISSRNTPLLLSIGGSASGLPGSGNLPVWQICVHPSTSLKKVVQMWAKNVLHVEDEVLPDDMRVSGKPDAPSLNLSSSVSALRPHLAVRNGRLFLSVLWPVNPAQTAVGAPDSSAKTSGRAKASVGAKLANLKISSRYSKVDRETMGWHHSKSFQSKLRSGFYGKAGDYTNKLPTGHGKAMQPTVDESADTGNPALLWPGELESRTLVVYSRQKSNSVADELFRVLVHGPSSQLENWAAACDVLGSKGRDMQLLSSHVPFPVFLPSVGRAKRAHLNWEAAHVFGPPDGSKHAGHRPVICLVVEPQEEAAYREAWPSALMLILPESGRGPSYARWVIQMVCLKAYELPNEDSLNATALSRRLSFCWVCDDNLQTFFRLAGTAKGVNGSKHAIVHKKRDWQDSKPMFKEAFLAVQQHRVLQHAAIAGFLRDDGTAGCKKRDWLTDTLSIYKVVLLNIRELQRLGVEYLPDLKKFEDIYLNNMIQRKHGRTLKCQSFCFRAIQLKSGGCKAQRDEGKVVESDRQQWGGLIDRAKVVGLPEEQKHAVQELLQWVQLKEMHCEKRKQQGHGRSKDALQSSKSSLLCLADEQDDDDVVEVQDNSTSMVRSSEEGSETAVRTASHFPTAAVWTTSLKQSLQKPHADIMTSCHQDCPEDCATPAPDAADRYDKPYVISEDLQKAVAKEAQPAREEGTSKASKKNVKSVPPVSSVSSKAKARDSATWQIPQISAHASSSGLVVRKQTGSQTKRSMLSTSKPAEAPLAAVRSMAVSTGKQASDACFVKRSSGRSDLDAESLSQQIDAVLEVPAADGGDEKQCQPESEDSDCELLLGTLQDLKNAWGKKRRLQSPHRLLILQRLCRHRKARHDADNAAL